MTSVQTSTQRLSTVGPRRVLSEVGLAEEIRKAVSSLVCWPGLRRIWLFGSAVRGADNLDWRSDLDFAVEGLPREHLERAWAMLDEAVRMPVDLVRIETANPTLRAAILRKGRVVYET